MWLVVAVATVKRALNKTIFFAPCLGTNLYAKHTTPSESEDLEKVA
jgi:hypothetical protein